MSSQPDRPSSDPSGNKQQSTNNVWVVLLVVVGVVLLSAFLIGKGSRRMRYPDLIALLERTADAREMQSVSPGTQVAGDEATPVTPPTSGNAASDNAVSDNAVSGKAASGKAVSSDVVLGDDAASRDVVPDNDASPLATITVSSTKNAEIPIEYSGLRDILVWEEVVTGKIQYRTRAKDGSLKKWKEVDFETVRDAPNLAVHERLTQKLNASGVTWDNAPPHAFAEYWPLLITLTFFLLLAVFLLRRLSGMGSPMSFSRSRGKLYSQDDLSVTFDDAAGIDEAVEEVREIVDFLKNSEKYQSLGGRIPKGVLLVGPPGTGKTLLAKAIAGEAGVPFFSLSGSDFVEMYVGVGAARVRDMFSQATSQAPSIIFIDELDALGRSRSGASAGGHDEREQTLNALLVEMDGFDSNNGVIVVAATNRPEILDPALLRPGRFDRHVLVDRPDIGGREEILKVHARNVKLDEAVDLRKIASITPGFVGADLQNLVNEAALLAARAGKKMVGNEQLNEAVERVTTGLEKKNRVMNEDEKIRIAYHESGHAVVAAALPNTDPVHKISIIPRGLAALGYMMQRPESERYLVTQSELESQMKVLLAGTLAEEMIFQDVSTGAQNDLERCTEIARSMVMEYGMSRLGRINFRRSNRSAFLAGGGGEGYQMMHSDEMAKSIDKEVNRLIDDALIQTREILEQRREVLEAVTQRLLEVEVIDNEELTRLIEQNSTGPWLVPGWSLEPRPKPPKQSSLP